MIVNAYQTAFHREGSVKIRKIVLSDEEMAGQPTAAILNKAFEQGQNMFVNVPGCYSVSVGDVIEIPGRGAHRVLGCGFAELAAGEFPKDLLGQAAQDKARGY